MRRCDAKKAGIKAAQRIQAVSRVREMALNNDLNGVKIDHLGKGVVMRYRNGLGLEMQVFAPYVPRGEDYYDDF